MQRVLGGDGVSWKFARPGYGGCAHVAWSVCCCGCGRGLQSENAAYWPNDRLRLAFALKTTSLKKRKKVFLFAGHYKIVWVATKVVLLCIERFICGEHASVAVAWAQRPTGGQPWRECERNCQFWSGTRSFSVALVDESRFSTSKKNAHRNEGPGATELE